MTDVGPVRALLNAECDAFLLAADHFRSLLPSAHHSGAAHAGEEGRYVESIVTEWLRRSLPERVEVGTGFVVDLAREHTSYQVDVIVWDRLSYAPHLRFGDAVVVPWQAVLAAISVKKRLRSGDVRAEAESLGAIGAMCGTGGDRHPYLSLLGLESDLSRKPATAVETVFGHLTAAYPPRLHQYAANELIDSVIVLNEFMVRKERWRGGRRAPARTEARYRWTGGDGPHRNVYLQELLHGIETSLGGSRALPGPAVAARDFGVAGMGLAGALPVCTENRPYHDGTSGRRTRRAAGAAAAEPSAP